MSLYQELMGNNNQATDIDDIVNAYKNTNNPQQLLMNMAMRNPKIQEVLNMINQSGRTPKDLFFSLANQIRIDPNIILNMLKK